MNLEGARALITGAGSGIGYSVARKLVDSGCATYSFDVQVPSEQRPGISSLEVDVTNPQQVAWGMAQIPGKLDVLFNNAGVLVRGGLFEITYDQFHQMVEVNALGSWLVLKTALEQEKLTSGATVIQMCSIVGGPDDRRIPAAKLRPYSLSKILVQGLIEAVQTDFPNLQFKAVYPGAVKTPMTMQGFASEQEYDEQALANWGHISTADEVAGEIILLLTTNAKRLVWDSNNKCSALE